MTPDASAVVTFHRIHWKGSPEYANSEDACQRCCLWVFWSAEVVVFTLDPTRSARVPKQHFATVTGGVVSVDRFSSYKRLAKDTELVLSFCWVYVAARIMMRKGGIVASDTRTLHVSAT